jgi:hypothetical protein
MLIDLNKAISNDLEPNMIHDHNLSLLIQMNAEARVHSNIALVSPAVIEQGEDQTNLQVGMVLPKNLDFDTSLVHHYNVPLSFLESSISPNGYRLWAKHFTPCGFSGGVSVPRCWSDFLTLSLLHPLRFEWAKAILGKR